MIQAIQETDFTAYIETEAKRIDRTVTSAYIRHLAKFTNDLDGAVFYAYAASETINDRYTNLAFKYNPVPDIYAGLVDLKPSGYFKYELYEVSWIDTPEVATGYAPATETDVLTPVEDAKGVVQGLVAIGKLYLGEKSGEEEVSYTEYEAPTGTNYIYTGVASPDIFNEYSLLFDGVDDVLITTKDSSIMPADNLTVGCWINPDTWAFTGNAQNRFPFGCRAGGGWVVGFENNYNATVTTFAGHIYVSDNGTGSAGYLSVETDSDYSVGLRSQTGWHYIAFTYTKATGVAALYMDGKEVLNATGATGADIAYHPSIDEPLTFGADAHSSGGEDYFEGNIDEPSVWNTALSAAELLAVYNNGIPINLLSNTGDYVSSSDLQGWWRMGDPNGSTAYPTIKDVSGNTNDGTMTNMTSGDIVNDVP